MCFENVSEPFLRSVSKYPNRLAVIFKQRKLTYAQLNARINQLVGILKKEYAIVPGSKVAYLLPNSFEVLEVYYAIQKIGAIAVPLNFKLIPREIKYLTEACDAELLIFAFQFHDDVKEAGLSSDLQLASFGGAGVGVGDLDALQTLASADEPLLYCDIEAVSRIQYTGGSTGLPKGAIRTHAADLAELKGVVASNHIDRDRKKVVLIQCPLEHHGGHSWFTSALATGAALVICDAFSAEGILDKIERFKVSYMILLPPSTYLRLLDCPSIDDYDLSSVRLVQSAAGATTKKVISKIFRYFPHAVLNYGWGQTESGLGTSLVIERCWMTENSEKLKSIGTAMLGAKLRIVDENGKDVKRGQTGEALIKSEAVMKGYYGQTELTKQAFTDDQWLRTGDMMMQDDDGFYYLRSRKKDMVKSGGENVFVDEVERTINSNPDVDDCVVFGTEDELMMEAIAAVVQIRVGS